MRRSYADLVLNVLLPHPGHRAGVLSLIQIRGWELQIVSHVGNARMRSLEKLRCPRAFE